VIDQRAQRLLARILDRLGAERRVDAGILGEHGEVVEAQHVVEERAHARLEARARQHAVDRLREARPGVELAVFGGAQELVVGTGIPQEEAEPARERVGVEPSVTRARRHRPGAIHDEQRLRGEQQSLERDGKAAVEIVELVRGVDAARHDRVGLGLVEWAPEQQAPDRQQEGLRTATVGFRFAAGGAGHEVGAVGGAHDLLGERSCRALELLHLRDGHAGARAAAPQQPVGALERREVRRDRDIRPNT
jgi:hypothetical protein